MLNLLRVLYCKIFVWPSLDLFGLGFLEIIIWLCKCGLIYKCGMTCEVWFWFASVIARILNFSPICWLEYFWTEFSRDNFGEWFAVWIFGSLHICLLAIVVDFTMKLNICWNVCSLLNELTGNCRINYLAFEISFAFAQINIFEWTVVISVQFKIIDLVFEIS